MNVPAEAARAPSGDTYPMTGTFEFKIAWVISRMEDPRPPGVSIVMSTAAAPCSFARSIPPRT